MPLGHLGHTSQKQKGIRFGDKACVCLVFGCFVQTKASPIFSSTIVSNQENTLLWVGVVFVVGRQGEGNEKELALLAEWPWESRDGLRGGGARGA